MSCEKRLVEADHHQQQALCTSRPSYRQGRKLTAVKTYTISTESQHLFIYGVPKINLRNELKKLCSSYGQIQIISPMEEYKTEIFTECYHVYYQRIQSARIAKRFLDNKSFYGGVLHVCYAPEFETVEDTQRKLWQRTKDVTSRLNRSDTKLKPITATATNAFPNGHRSKQEDGEALSFHHNNIPSYGNITQSKWSEMGSLGSSDVQQNMTVIKTSYDVARDQAETESSIVEHKPKHQQDAAYSWKERKMTDNKAPSQCKDLKFPDPPHLGNDTDDIKDSNSMPLRKHQQTPDHYWKESGKSNISFKLQNRKRSGFIPRQVSKKQKQSIT